MFKEWILNWLRSEPPALRMNLSSTAQVPDETPNFTLSIMNAINGKVIHIRTHKPQRNGPDWVSEYYIVPDGEKLTDAVSILLMAKNLETA